MSARHIPRPNKIRATCERDSETDEPLWWSNEDGWVDEASATTFTDREREYLRLPVHRLHDGAVVPAGEWYPPRSKQTRFRFDD